MSKYTDNYKKYKEFIDSHEDRYIGFYVPSWIYEYLEQCESPINGDRYGSASEACKDFLIQHLMDCGEFKMAKEYWELRSEELLLWLRFIEGDHDD